MIQSKRDLKFYIAADRIMNGQSEKKTIKEAIINAIDRPMRGAILDYLYALRHYAYYRNTIKKQYTPRLILMLYWHRKWNKLGLKLGFSIGPNALGYGVVIPHYGTIVVNSEARIGNFSVLHTCTCVAGGDKEIGDYFYLSTGSQIVGRLYLGHGCTVAAHTLVNKSFEGNTLLVGAPAVRKREGYPNWIERGDAHWKERINKVLNLKKSCY